MTTGAHERRVYIGTAGWSIPRTSADRFGGDGPHLRRYARRLSCTEINSSFHRPHLVATYARWGASVPPEFRFAVKVPRAITHDMKLRRARAPFLQFLGATSGLQERRGPLLLQLPPSLAFDGRVAARFFDVLRALCDGPVVCEPRHPTWFSARGGELLDRYHVARVAADPPPVAGADLPGGWDGLVYFRLHGAPRKYWSAYGMNHLVMLAAAVREIPETADVWFVFDNTASGAALENASQLQMLLGGCDGSSSPAVCCPEE